MLSEKEKRIINQRTRKMLKSKKEFKAMIDTSLSPEAASKVWKDAHKRLARMYSIQNKKEFLRWNSKSNIDTFEKLSQRYPRGTVPMGYFRNNMRC